MENIILLDSFRISRIAREKAETQHGISILLENLSYRLSR